MYKYSDIRDIHFEVTTRCQAKCPMCPRRFLGGPLNPLISLSEISLSTFKQWFPLDFVKQLNSFFMCGNLGDPVVAEDTLQIFEYLRECNPAISLSMHTNGSARSLSWWEQLALIRVKVIFGIDGLSDTHALYRVSTNWEKIIENATAFINAGGEAHWNMLVFKHNEHQVNDCRQLSKELGFSHFEVKHTSRFKSDKVHVLNDRGKTTHILHPTDISKSFIQKVNNAITTTAPVINCKALKYKQIYVSGTGNVSPCCWLDLEWIPPIQDSRIDYLDKIGDFPNLNSQSLREIFESDFFNKIEKTWNIDPLQECTKQCGIFDRLTAQFIDKVVEQEK